MYKRPSEPAYHIVDCRISKFQHRMVQPKDVRNLNGLCFRFISKKVSLVQISLQKMKKIKKMYKWHQAQRTSLLYCRLSDFKIPAQDGATERCKKLKWSLLQIHFQESQFRSNLLAKNEKRKKKCTNGTGQQGGKFFFPFLFYLVRLDKYTVQI